VRRACGNHLDDLAEDEQPAARCGLRRADTWRVLMRGAESNASDVVVVCTAVLAKAMGTSCGPTNLGATITVGDVAGEQITISARRVMDAGLTDRCDYVHESATDLPQEDEGRKVGNGDDIGHQQTQHICRTLKRQHAVAIPCVLFA
jgi:hypothetical protein